MTPRTPTHAGGVVFRVVADTPEYLLVRANSPTEEWVLPKGHIEAGESAEAAAIREVREETGVEACIYEFLDHTCYERPLESVCVANYLMRALEIGEPLEQRSTSWCDVDRALAELTYEDSRNLVARAHTLLTE